MHDLLLISVGRKHYPDDKPSLPYRNAPPLVLLGCCLLGYTHEFMIFSFQVIGNTI